jgi:hypothetical protein
MISCLIAAQRAFFSLFFNTVWDGSWSPFTWWISCHTLLLCEQMQYFVLNFLQWFLIHRAQEDSRGGVVALLPQLLMLLFLDWRGEAC